MDHDEALRTIINGIIEGANCACCEPNGHVLLIDTTTQAR